MPPLPRPSESSARHTADSSPGILESGQDSGGVGGRQKQALAASQGDAWSEGLGAEGVLGTPGQAVAGTHRLGHPSRRPGANKGARNLAGGWGDVCEVEGRSEAHRKRVMKMTTQPHDITWTNTLHRLFLLLPRRSRRPRGRRPQESGQASLTSSYPPADFPGISE